MSRSPTLHGFGLGLRSAHAEALLQYPEPQVDWLELVPENWMFHGGQRRRQVQQLAERYLLVPHSVSLDIGGLSALDEVCLSALQRLIHDIDAPLFSDHLCYSTIDGQPLHDLLPLPTTAASIERVGERGRTLRARFERPLVLENITYYAPMPGDPDLDEVAFLTACLQAADAGLLLDVNNVYVNACNHGFDAYALLDRLPLQRVSYMHLAGHSVRNGLLIDTHSGPVCEAVWDLYRHVLRRIQRPVPTLIEWDQQLPALEVLLAEVARARQESATVLAAVAAETAR